MAYYINRGHSLEYLLNLTETEKLFFIESMNLEIENKVKFEEMKYKALLGGEKSGK
ncbi:conserved hypothetical protein [Clostridium neonatale]|uniref:hypothetical protein n=1 Tax=Clostridium neonatale TaxID=137838 RepID=UPI00291B5D9B|nr:hypothetical protein [Clostridium neonatale]CAI3699904.1 conserved hypothetical protein [Clostridium neonatale]